MEKGTSNWALFFFDQAGSLGIKFRELRGIRRWSSHGMFTGVGSLKEGWVDRPVS